MYYMFFIFCYARNNLLSAVLDKYETFVVT